MTRSTHVSASDARAVLDLYAEVHGDKTGYIVPTGHDAYRRALGPVLMVPDAMSDAIIGQADKVLINDTMGNGHPAIVLEGETAFCSCCDEIAGCWTTAVQEAADERGMPISLQPYAPWAVGIYQN